VCLAGQGGNVERLRKVSVDQILRTAKMNVDRDRVAHSPERLEQLRSASAPVVGLGALRGAERALWVIHTQYHCGDHDIVIGAIRSAEASADLHLLLQHNGVYH
jgi:flavin reductase (DIM6/NTAB) family NADH-FMN oxidoreductase RutF